MRVRWDQANSRWEASVGSGKNRVWFRSKVAGETGKLAVIAKLQEYLEPPEVAPGTLAEFVEKVWWPTAKPTLSDRSVESYLSIYNHHIRAIESHRLVDMRLPVLQQWISEIGRTRAPKTTVSIYSVLRTILQMAYDLGDYPHRDFERVKLPSIPKKTGVQALSPEEIKKLLTAAKGKSIEGPIWAAAFLGLRRGEVAGLKIPHINLLDDRAIITVTDNRQSKGREGRLKSKAEGETRRIAVPRPFGEKLLSFSRPGSMYLFTVQGGKPIAPDSLTKAVPELCAKAGIPKVNFHALRHSCASNLRSAGVPESMIKDILGHSGLAMTAHYLHTRDQEMVDAFARVNLDA